MDVNKGNINTLSFTKFKYGIFIQFFYLSILLLSSAFCIGQKENYLNIDLGLTQNYNGFIDLYDGILEIGGGYNKYLTGNLFGSANIHFAFFNRTNTNARAVFYKPKLNVHYKFSISDRINIIPLAAIGYTVLNLSNKEFDYSEIQTGVNMGFDLRILWNNENQVDYYFFGRFDYIYLDKDKDFTRLNYYRKIYLSSFGLGIKIKSKNKDGKRD